MKIRMKVCFPLRVIIWIMFNILNIFSYLCAFDYDLFARKKKTLQDAAKFGNNIYNVAHDFFHEDDKQSTSIQHYTETVTG